MTFSPVVSACRHETQIAVVVNRDAGVWMQKLIPVHQELFGVGRSDPLAPVMLEVIDHATDEALQRLEKAGLVTRTTRAARLLDPAANGAVAVPLSEEEQRKAEAHRGQAARKLKISRLLGDGELVEEARESLLGAIHSLGRAFAVEGRWPEPAEPKEITFPPHTHRWGVILPDIQNFLADSSACWKKNADHVARLLAEKA